MSTETAGTSFQIKRARRSQARLRMALAAVSGAGKTMGALRMAKGLVQKLLDMGVLEGGLEGKICLIDSERKSSQLYADVAPFDTIELEPPYSVDRYQQAIAAVERAGYAICIIDQISHAWAGPGGQLEFVDALKARGGNQMSPWTKVTPIQQEFYDRMLRSTMHLIVTMRCKSEYVIQEVNVDGRIKKVPVKIGLSPVQRDGIEYEFTTCLDIDLESHMATASKDRTRLFMDKQTFIDESTGGRLAEWLQSGEAIQLMEAPKDPPPAAGPAGERVDAARAKFLKELVDGVEDLKLSYAECATLPDLAAQFDKAQKFVKGFKDSLGVETCRPYLDDVTAAKDARKASIQNPPATKPRVILWNEKNEVVGESNAPLKPGDPWRKGDGITYIVGALAQKTADGETYYAKLAPATDDLLGQADPNKLSIEDVKRLTSFAVNEGLDDKETLEALGVKDIADLPKAAYAEATDKILKAARAKVAKKPARARKEKAAA